MSTATEKRKHLIQGLTVPEASNPDLQGREHGGRWQAGRHVTGTAAVSSHLIHKQKAERANW